MSVKKAVVGTDLTIRIPTGDATLATYLSYGIGYKDPNGVAGSLPTPTVYNSSYISAPLSDADNDMLGEWFFWGFGTTPTGEFRKTHSIKVRVVDEGEEV